MIKNIVFDMGNVLIKWIPETFMKGCSETARELLGKEIYYSENWLRLDRGELSEEEKRAKCSDIFKQCEREVEERGKPVAVVAVDVMPLTPMGKNDYRAIGKTYKDYDYKSWIK